MTKETLHCNHMSIICLTHPKARSYLISKI